MALKTGLLTQWDSQERDDIARQLAELMETPASGRTDMLTRQSPARRAALERLLELAEDETAETRLRKTIDRFMGSLVRNAPGAPIVPRWLLLERVGEGGMAEVFRAERSDGVVEQEAAIKLLWPGMMSAGLSAKFEQERQILAGLTHPNIARLLDGGVADDGRPWLATELVNGDALDDHCANRALDLDSRLALFADVCAAVAHAHRKLVVHRDIKPNNTLVDAEGRVKLLDFGIAKMLQTGSAPTDTQTGARLMTPEYSSPEMLEGSSIDTRSDIFQLGVMLYQLVWGKHPFVADGMSVTQRQRAIVEAESPPPTKSATHESGVAGRIPGELYAIVCKAAARKPDDRYQTVEALADDLRRLGNGLPVSAKSPTTMYRLRKFLGRHAVASSVTAVFCVSLIGYAVLASVQSQRLAQSSAVNQAVGQFMASFVDPEAGNDLAPGVSRTAAVLKAEVQRVQRELRNQPVVQSRVMNLLAAAFLVDEALDGTTDVVRHAVAKAYQMHSVEEHLSAVVDMAYVANFSGAHDEAEALLDGVIGIAGDDPTLEATTRRAAIMLADVRHSLGRYGSALHVLRGLRSLPSAAPRFYQVLGMVLKDAGQYAEAGIAFAEAERAVIETLGKDSPKYAMLMEHYGQWDLATGDYSMAEERFAKARAIRERLAGPDGHIWTDHWLANLRALQARLDESEALLRKTVRAYELRYSKRSQLLAYAQSDLGWALTASGDYDAAIDTFLKAERGLRRSPTDVHARLVEPLLGRAVVLMITGRSSQALPLVKEAYRLKRERLPSDHSDVTNVCWLLRRLNETCEPARDLAPGIEGDRLKLVTSISP